MRAPLARVAGAPGSGRRRAGRRGQEIGGRGVGAQQALDFGGAPPDRRCSRAPAAPPVRSAGRSSRSSSSASTRRTWAGVSGGERDRSGVMGEEAITNAMHADTWKFAPAYELPSWPFVAPPELASGQRIRHPVVIAGGGLAGLTLACDLAAARRRGRAARRGRHRRRARRLVARHLLRAKEPRDVRPARHLRADPRQGHHLVGRPHLLGRRRDLHTSTSRTRASREQPPFINLQQFYLEWFLVERILELDAGVDPLEDTASRGSRTAPTA